MRFILTFLLVAAVTMANAQSATTEALQKKYSDNSRAFFFYNNTLRMLNQSEDKELDALIKDIEKLKFLMIDKRSKFADGDYKKIVKDYKGESFEEAMSSRYQGKNFDIFIKEKNGDTKGMLVLINDSTNLFVLDIVGKIALDKITKLYSTMNESSDLGERIKRFTSSENK
ncbi:DUF4252 domain-containing protein [Ohtaekwangia kribbensis]|jgi:hypothetical protein|uniref:DUF4252 domain-containing protein n=1 Tax=Ohtaekwangia kribbensis TaxID=688913 RepID=A0ABW3K1L6_9BACT